MMVNFPRLQCNNARQAWLPDAVEISRHFFLGDCRCFITVPSFFPSEPQSRRWLWVHSQFLFCSYLGSQHPPSNTTLCWIQKGLPTGSQIVLGLFVYFNLNSVSFGQHIPELQPNHKCSQMRTMFKISPTPILMWRPSVYIDSGMTLNKCSSSNDDARIC